MEESLKDIFDSMYKKLSELSIGNGFFEWINEARTINFKEIKKESDDFLFEILVKTVFAGGFRSNIVDEKWPNIKKVFDDFVVNKIANYNKQKITQIINTPPYNQECTEDKSNCK